MSAKNNKGKLAIGMIMTAVFAVVLVIFFMPVFNGHNGLNYLDQLYNSISKGSAYYIPELSQDAAKYNGAKLEVTLDLGDKGAAARAALLFAGAGATAAPDGAKLKVSGDLGKVFTSSLADSDAMFHNQGDKLSARYQGKDPKLMLYTWWTAYKALEKALNRQEAFGQAKFAGTVQAKAVEMSYNYYGIEPQSIGDKWLIVVLSLLFYVIYTLWYGYGVMYLFEGTGYQLEH
ncbi:MAG: hypothetical protein K9K66_17055 [Desulfarculaceae bacterium]|nr:hypothetical protein [Desulfarculaceae bacterium]MCF8074301.1 hypothetical protein [Desulfarculaceae bacterium]MCF8103369.1 hypothetical protein [Desulfarculaceae bacterium]MCF8117776.1 hypothetical protein [Desulfarculaceae bacterium]